MHVDDTGPVHGIHVEFSPHHNASQKGDRVGQTRNGQLPALRCCCTGDANRRFSPLPGAPELHQAVVRSAERLASPYSVQYESCRRDNSEHIRG